MLLFGVLLILTVALVGGLIAFVGDRVGMRVGRKRLTLFGLRPKYTSIGIAVLTGIITATSTLGILSAASENVRIAVFHLTQLREDLREVTAKNESQKAELTSVTEKWESARAELQVIDSTLRGLRRKIANLDAARAVAQKALTTAQTDLVTTAADLAMVREQYDQAAEDLQAAQEEVQFIQQRREILENYIQVLSDEVDNLLQQREFLGTGVIDFAYQPIILHLGEVLVAQVIYPDSSFAEIDTAVLNLLNEADRIARERGAVIENKKISTRVDIKRLTDAYQVLFDLKEPAILRVVSGTNTIAGKPAFIYLDVLLDKVIFKQGEVVAKITVEESDSTEAIFTRMINELIPAACRAAEAKGMLTEAGEVPIPSLSYTALNRAAVNAVIIRGRVEIRLTAARDLRRAGDELDLVLVLQRV